MFYLGIVIGTLFGFGVAALFGKATHGAWLWDKTD